MASVTGTFSGTGASSVLIARNVDVSLSGGASATVAIEREVNGAWKVIESITGDAERVIENNDAYRMRLECTAYTSGTVTYAMIA